MKGPAHFTEVEGDHVILKSAGVFHQKKLFRRHNEVYAQWGSGFIRLCEGTTTSHTKVQCIEILSEAKMGRDALGRLTWIE